MINGRNVSLNLSFLEQKITSKERKSSPAKHKRNLSKFMESPVKPQTKPTEIEIDLNSSMSYKILDNKHYYDKVDNIEPMNYVISKQDQRVKPVYHPSDHENCERRHNITVKQYESVLKTLNTEFKTLLERNQLLEERVALSQYNSYSPDHSESVDIQLKNQQNEHNNLSERLVSEVSRVKKENVSLAMQLNQASLIIEELKKEVFNKNLM